MARYTVAHAYRSTVFLRGDGTGETIGFSEGDTVEVDDVTAEWVNRDSPGTLDATVEDRPDDDEGTGEQISGETVDGVELPPAAAEVEPEKPRRKRGA